MFIVVVCAAYTSTAKKSLNLVAFAGVTDADKNDIVGLY
jgi:hypothetical protein